LGLFFILKKKQDIHDILRMDEKLKGFLSSMDCLTAEGTVFDGNFFRTTN